MKSSGDSTDNQLTLADTEPGENLALEMKCLSAELPATWSPFAEVAPRVARNLRSMQNAAERLVCRRVRLHGPREHLPM